MSVSPLPASVAPLCDEQRSVEISDYSTISYVRYKDLDINNLIKCIDCRNYTDITCEQYNERTLAALRSLMSSSDPIIYTCNHCRSMKETFKSVSSYIDELLVKQDEQKLMVAERQHALDLKVKAMSAAVTRADANVTKLEMHVNSLADKKTVPKHKELPQSNKQEKVTSDSSSHDENLVIPIRTKEVVSSLHPITKTEDISVCSASEKKNYLRRKRLVFIGVPKEMDDKTFINELSEELNLGLEESSIKKTFRIKARSVPVGKSPPLNVEFRYAKDRSNILNQRTRDKIANLPPLSKFHDVKFFPDRPYKHRKKYKDLKMEMDARNLKLLDRNVRTLKWTIKNMSLTKVIDLGVRVKTQ